MTAPMSGCVQDYLAPSQNRHGCRYCLPQQTRSDIHCLVSHKPRKSGRPHDRLSQLARLSDHNEPFSRTERNRDCSRCFGGRA